MGSGEGYVLVLWAGIAVGARGICPGADIQDGILGEGQASVGQMSERGANVRPSVRRSASGTPSPDGVGQLAYQLGPVSASSVAS